MSDFLLIHGTAHGAWCWDATVAALHALGHRARAIDLPGCGTDRTPADAATLKACATAILRAIDGPTILVGHSAGGFPVTAAAQSDPTAITALVYLAAYVPKAGLTLADMRRAGPSQPLAKAFRMNAARTAFDFDPAIAADRFYHDCPPDIAARALARLTPQPLAPQETALAATDRAEGLPRHYIRCTADRTISPAYQTEMARGMALSDLPTGHSPFLSAPEALAQRLAEIATTTLSEGRGSS